MKKRLLIAAMGLVMTFSVKAQITLPKTWDFANDTTNWPLSSGIGVVEKTVDQLGLYSHSQNSAVNFGAITANSYTFPDGFSTVNRLQLNGAGFTSGNFSTTPTQRYLYFDVAGTATVKVWFRSGTNSAARTVFVTDGTAILGQATTDTAGTGVVITAPKTSTATQRIYVYGDTACNIYKITVESGTLATVDASKSAASIFSVGNQVHVKNLNVNTNISVYTMNGALVKTLSSKSDVAFDLKPGIYMINTTSEKGNKSQKVSVK